MSSLRTDDDTWDIATSVGTTAVMVAAARAGETDRDDPLIRDPYAKILVAGAGTGVWGLHARRRVRREGRRRRPRGRRDLRAHGQLPGGPHPFLRRILRQGARRRASARSSSWRRAWIRAPTGCRGRPEPPCTRSISPRCSSTSRRRWPQHGVEPSAQRREVPIDLRFDWPKALRDAGFDAGQSDRVAGRGPVDVPARRRPGPALRADHRRSAPRAAASPSESAGMHPKTAARRCGNDSNASPTQFGMEDSARHPGTDVRGSGPRRRRGVARRTRLDGGRRQLAGRDAPAGPLGVAGRLSDDDAFSTFVTAERR